jgi:hypothetical protein
LKGVFDEPAANEPNLLIGTADGLYRKGITGDTSAMSASSGLEDSAG